MPDYVLEIVEGPEAGRQIPLVGETVIGRDPAAASVALLQDELLSRRHVKLTPEADGVRVEDLESRNGTFVDGDQIYTPAHLAPGGQLVLGVTVLQLANAPEMARGATSVLQIPASLTHVNRWYVNWTTPFPPASQHISGHSYVWTTCVLDGSTCTSGCVTTSFTVP